MNTFTEPMISHNGIKTEKNTYATDGAAEVRPNDAGVSARVNDRRVEARDDREELEEGLDDALAGGVVQDLDDGLLKHGDGAADAVLAPACDRALAAREQVVCGRAGARV